MNIGVSIITCTNKPDSMKNIFNNYRSQVWPKKELVIILHRDDMDIEQWRREASLVPNISIYQVTERASLGECLNFATDQTKHRYIAFFDDDDYYAPLYLQQMMMAFQNTDADIIGKKTHYVYFKKSNALYLRFPNQENRYVDWVCGGKKIVKRNVFDQVRFRHISIDEDRKFCQDCLKHGFTIFSTDRFNLVYVRNADPKDHAWKISDKELKKSCQFITITDDYKSLCFRGVNLKQNKRK